MTIQAKLNISPADYPKFTQICWLRVLKNAVALIEQYAPKDDGMADVTIEELNEIADQVEYARTAFVEGINQKRLVK